MSPLRVPLSVQAKLRVISLALTLGMLLCGSVSWISLLRVEAVAREVGRQSAALSLLQAADMAHDAMRSAVMAAFLAGEVEGLTAQRVRADADVPTAEMRDALSRLATLDLEPQIRADLLATVAVADRYLIVADSVVAMALVDREAAKGELPAFNRAFEDLYAAFDAEIMALRTLNDRAVERAERIRRQANGSVALTMLVALALMMATVTRIGRSIRGSLMAVEGVATGVAGGDLERRAALDIDDEIGRLAGAVNAMADKLKHLLEQARGEAERHSFSHALTEALDMADSEPDAYRVIQRAMSAVSAEHPMELLVSDSSQAAMQRATAHPQAGAPGCEVLSPFRCQAVRRGSCLTFSDSEALNACPQLRGRAAAEGPISAVCVPLHFMGRALGVLHTAGPARQELSADKVAKLMVIGAHGASRIGVVRAFERTQLQAATDSATGLANRRALESRLDELMRRRAPFALIMADLDHFKKLNDTYGHLAGDEALKLFADVIRETARSEDIASRWGGEEFAVVLAGAPAQAALAWAGRARSALRQALDRNSKVPRFTASFGISDSTMADGLEGILRLADDALYHAKEQGRDRASVGGLDGAQAPSLRQMSEHLEAIDVMDLHVVRS